MHKSGFLFQFALCSLVLTGCSRSRTASSNAPGAEASNPETGKSPDRAALQKTTAVTDTDLPLGKIRVPPGFKVAAYATSVENARSMTLSPSHTLYIGTRDAGKVYAVPNADRDATGDAVVVVAKGLDKPNGVAFHAGSLYVAEISRVLRFDDIDARLNAPPEPVVVTDKLPDEEHHGWKFIAFGPDERLYVPIGAPCNICEKDDPFASIGRMNKDGSGFEVFARGIRNSVGFDWHPVTRELWFTDNGRDRMGEDVPPDELNRAAKPGLHFGYPYCHGTIADPELGKARGCANFEPPVQALGAHVAALGMRFYTGEMFPKEYKNQVFVAEHGSWNRSKKSGYRVALVRLEGNQSKSYEDFATGFKQEEDAWGRPVDVLQMPDGALLVSDDEADAVYRFSYQGAKGPA